MPDYQNLENFDTRWTPLTDEIRDWMDSLKKEAGSWRAVSEATGFKPRYLRRLRQRHATAKSKPLKAVSLRTMDRLFTLSDLSHRVQHLPWYTVEEIQEMGIWSPPLPHIERKASESGT